MSNVASNSRIERKKEETKKKIVSTAMKLFENQGFVNTTMEKIAVEVDIAKGTLYNYFSSKEAIVNEFVQIQTREHMPRLNNFLVELPDTRSRILAVLSKQINYIKENKEIMEKFLSYRLQLASQLHKDQSSRNDLDILFTKIIELGQEQREIRTDIPKEVLVTQLDFIRFFTIMSMLSESDNLSVEDSIVKNTEFFLNGAKR